MIAFDDRLWPDWAQNMKQDEGAELVIDYERNDKRAAGYEAGVASTGLTVPPGRRPAISFGTRGVLTKRCRRLNICIYVHMY